MSDNDNVKQAIVDAYLEQDPTPETSMNIVNQLAEEHGKSPNSFRMLLSGAGVYVKKTTSTTKGSSDKTDGDKPTRKSKETSLNELKEAIKKRGQDVNEEIISKLTGKAADYFTSVISSI